MRRTLIVASMIAAISMTASTVNASTAIVAFGLQSGSQSGGSGGSLGGRSNVEIRTPRDPAVEAHNRGRSLMSKKIGCKKCAHPGGVRDVVTARSVAERVRAGEFNLKDKERQLVLLYLSNQFGI